jgi:S-adenosylmethionine hydrolase
MIITLTTDLGTKDATSAMLAAIMARNVPGSKVVPLSHHITQHGWREAAYIMASSFHAFPYGTVHLSTVAPFPLAITGVLPGEKRKQNNTGMPALPIIAAKAHGQYFMAHDNGLLPTALGAEGMVSARLCYSFTEAYSLQGWAEHVLRIVKQLPSFFSEQANVYSPLMLPLPTPQVTPIGVVCHIRYIDRYNNIVVNLTRQDYETLIGNRPFSIRTFKGVNINTISTHYSDVPVGTPLCRFTAAGYLELAVNHGDATAYWGIDPDDKSSHDYHTIRISVQ